MNRNVVPAGQTSRPQRGRPPRRRGAVALEYLDGEPATAQPAPAIPGQRASQKSDPARARSHWRTPLGAKAALPAAVAVVMVLGEIVLAVVPVLRFWAWALAFLGTVVAAPVHFMAAWRVEAPFRASWVAKGGGVALIALALGIGGASHFAPSLGFPSRQTPDLLLAGAGVGGVVAMLMRRHLSPLAWATTTLDGVIFGLAVALGLGQLRDLMVLDLDDAGQSDGALLGLAVFCGLALAGAIGVRHRGVERAAPWVLGDWGYLVFLVGATLRYGLAFLGYDGAVGLPIWATAGLMMLMAAWHAAGSPDQEWSSGSRTGDDRQISRLRLLPVLAAGAVVVTVAAGEMWGPGPISAGHFLGAIALLGLVVVRSLLTLLENRLLIQRLQNSSNFERSLRDVGLAINTSLEIDQVLRLICQTGQSILEADVIFLWLVDRTTNHLEVVAAAGSHGPEMVGRRISIADRSSLAARIARSGRPEIVHHALAARRSNQFLTIMLHAQCLMGVPLTHGARVIGVLVYANCRSPDAFQQTDLAKAELLAAQAAAAIDNARLYGQVRRQLEEVSALYSFASSVGSCLTPYQVASELLRTLHQRVDYARASVFLVDPSTGALRLAAADGSRTGPGTPGDGTSKVPATVPRDVGLSEAALLAYSRGQPVRIATGPDGQGSGILRREMRSELAVPLSLKDRPLGVVDLESHDPEAYSETHERLVVSLANHAALAIDNLRLVEEARKVQALREMDRMKSDLLSVVSHELRTPLGSIKGYASMLLKYENKLRREEKREYIQIIDRESDRLTELIDNLLEMGRLEAGVLRIDRALVDVEQIAQESVQRARARTQIHDIVLTWEGSGEVIADARRIRQVLDNLLENAIKYSPDGGEIVVRGTSQPGWLAVSVTDHGIGIPPKEQERIFDRFHRVDGESSRKVGGTGLGLAICKGLIEAHGGRIWVESEPGRGSTFSFLLPQGSRESAPTAVVHEGKEP